MENASKKELLLTINKQKDQLSRYESRLRDVVTAYKGLTKEKEALEASLKAISGSNAYEKPSDSGNKASNAGADNDESDASKTLIYKVENDSTKKDEHQEEETVDHLRTQLSTLMNSLATLSAEKSRMEASFQADKKQLRQEKEEREKIVKELQEKHQQTVRVHQSELETLRSKLTVERHEREKEQNDHGVMIRELQKLLAEERRLKDQQENQIEELKTKVNQLESQSGQKEQYEKKLRDVRNELEATRRKLKRAEAKAKETPPLLLELQDEMANMKIQHQAAIFEEQKRATDAEERARRLAAVHEERVANLEARLAELSETVGNYDRLRQQDQMAIQKLKEHIAQLDIEQSTLSRVTTSASVVDSEEELKENSEVDLQTLVDKILHLKAQLLSASEHAEKPLDIQEILKVNDYFGMKNNEHKLCQEEYQQLKLEFEQYKQSHLQLPNNTRMEDNSEVSSLRIQVKTLKDRVRILNGQLEDTDAEWKQKVDNLQQLLKTERTRFKEELTANEMDYRGRLSLLEQQLQKQRERSLSLLEEKEQEIRTLKSTFQMFLPGNIKRESPTNLLDTTVLEAVAGSGNVMDNLSQSGGVIWNLSRTGGGESPHMLHYAHELARRDVEISNLRKAKHRLECALRELQRVATTEEDKHREEVDDLKEEVARLQRCQSREGANLEYLKNVVLSFLLSSDSNCKRHMLNAIAAVLKFSSSELERVSCTYKTPVQGNLK
ncbi:GRIP and coiled-coil domain-containing protein 1 isoform X1 [Periplaneta americana]|uniref:GRIP and coiled-coil domain-containing protein 1 isoform X1 n=1 Tax=Periplaneta americana TaxID=6978 RepID=UPI0037E77510